MAPMGFEKSRQLDRWEVVAKSVHVHCLLILYVKTLPLKSHFAVVIASFLYADQAVGPLELSTMAS